LCTFEHASQVFQGITKIIVMGGESGLVWV
jgi:hypothetical protein